jgi:TonB family protein
MGGYHKKETTKVDLSDFFIKGDAKDRIIMYKPDLDKVIEMPSDFNSDFSASVGFRISEDGFVKYAECVVSSGFPEIDQAAIRYVRKWQFVPNPKDDQEGIVRVSFE